MTTLKQSILLSLSALILPASASITSVTETNLNGDTPATIATGFGEESLTFSDRTHQHNGAAFEAGLLNTAGTTIVDLPEYLIGGDHVQFANNARENIDYEAVITTDVTSEFYLLIDNRLDGPNAAIGSPNTDDPILGGTLQWVIDGGWERMNTGISPDGQADYTGVDESGNGVGPGQGLNQFYSVYKYPINATTVTVGGNQINGTNMISLVAVPAPDGGAPIGSFAAAPPTISEGESASLNWIISQSATTASIDQGIGDVLVTTVDGRGSVDVSPTVTTTYTLNVDTPEGSESSELTVAVRLISSFTADNVFINAGDPVTFSWATRSDASLTLTDAGSVNPVSSSVTLKPTRTTTYVLSATAGDETQTAEIEVRVQSAGVLYGLIDLGATDGMPEAGALSGAVVGAGINNDSAINLAPTVLTSATGDEFTIAIDNIDQDGLVVGNIDWRDRGDSTGEPLTFLGEDLLKNNDGVIRVTLGSLPAGTYEIVSWHFDPTFSQGEDIRILVSDAQGTAVDTEVIGDASYIFPVASLDNTTANMNGQARIFSVSSNGNDDVMIHFDARAGVDTEVPLNGLQIKLTGGATGPEVVRLTADQATKTLTLEFKSIPDATYAIYAGPDLENITEELSNNVIGQAGTTTYTETGIDPTAVLKRFYRVERLD